MEYNDELIRRKTRMSGSVGRRKRINCFKCAHFRITYKPEKPRACSIFGFQGKELPSATVFRVTGKNCPIFTPKKQ